MHVSSCSLCKIDLFKVKHKHISKTTYFCYISKCLSVINTTAVLVINKKGLILKFEICTRDVLQGWAAQAAWEGCQLHAWWYSRSTRQKPKHPDLISQLALLWVRACTRDLLKSLLTWMVVWHHLCLCIKWDSFLFLVM